MQIPYLFIEKQADLERILPDLLESKSIAVDLEADSMFHFREKICLLQLGTETGNFVLDPLAISDLSLLAPIFADKGIRKVFHGADYDIRSLFRDYGFVVHNMWDTELATRFLGHRTSGLDTVLQDRFGVSLDKRFQKKDWSKRPLSDDMIAYAAGDTNYLIPLWGTLREELREKNRLEWVREEFRILQQVRSNDPEEKPLFLRFKGAGRLSPRELAILEALLVFRLEMARKKDKPVFKIVGNEAILRITKLMPKNLGQIRTEKILSPKLCNMYGDGIMDAVHGAMLIPDKELPRYPKKRMPRVTPQIAARVEAMKEWRNTLAEDLDLDPALLCNKALLSQLAHLNPEKSEDFGKIPEMRIWQQDLLGEGFLKALSNLAE